MKKSFKIAIVALMLILTVFIFSTSVFADEIDPSKLKAEYKGSTNEMMTIAQNVMGLIRNIAIIAGVIILMVIGVKFILGSAEEKAEYKKSLIPLVVGIVIVISATTLVSFIFNFAK